MMGMLNSTCTITPQTWTTDANGHPVRSAGTAVTAPCAIQTISTSESERYRKLQDSEVMALYLPAGVTIDSSATVTHDGKVYEVRSLAEDMGGRGRGQKVILERVP